MKFKNVGLAFGLTAWVLALGATSVRANPPLISIPGFNFSDSIPFPGFNSSESSANSYFSQGNSKLKKGDYQGAIEDFTQAIRLNHNYAEAYYNRGLLLIS